LVILSKEEVVASVVEAVVVASVVGVVEMLRRAWMIVDARPGVILSDRKLSSMARAG
jgi:hypothetical protein